MSSLTTENALRQQLRQHRQQLDLLTSTFTAADLRLVLVDSLQKLDALSPPEKVDEGETKTSNVGSQGVTTPYVLRKGGYFVKKFDSSYNNFFSVWEH